MTRWEMLELLDHLRWGVDGSGSWKDRDTILGEFDRLTAELARLQAELAAEREAQRWIPVTEGLPTEAGVYLFGWLYANGEWRTNRMYFDPSIPATWQGYTHWQSMPAAPNEAPL